MYVCDYRYVLIISSRAFRQPVLRNIVNSGCGLPGAGRRIWWPADVDRDHSEAGEGGWWYGGRDGGGAGVLWSVDVGTVGDKPGHDCRVCGDDIACKISAIKSSPGVTELLHCNSVPCTNYLRHYFTSLHFVSQGPNLQKNRRKNPKFIISFF